LLLRRAKSNSAAAKQSFAPEAQSAMEGFCRDGFAAGSLARPETLLTVMRS
jgi:hypothetical protein